MEGYRGADLQEVNEAEGCVMVTVGCNSAWLGLRQWSSDSLQVPDTGFLPLDSGRSPWPVRQAGP